MASYNILSLNKNTMTLVRMDLDQAPAVEDDDNEKEGNSDEEEMGPSELENIFEADQVDLIASQTVASTQTTGEVTPMTKPATIDDANHDTEENKVEQAEKNEKAPVKDKKQKKKNIKLFKTKENVTPKVKGKASPSRKKKSANKSGKKENGKK